MKSARKICASKHKAYATTIAIIVLGRRKERASRWNTANGLSVKVGAILIGEVHLVKKDSTIYPRQIRCHNLKIATRTDFALYAVSR